MPWRAARRLSLSCVPRPALTALTALALAFVPLTAHAAPRTAAGAAPSTYTNPVIPRTAPDPAIIKAHDGYYYIVATSDTWQDGVFHLLPTWRSTDLVNWQFVGDAVPSRPSWVAPTAGLWAPDLQYFNHKYYMYYVASDTVAGGSAIGLFTAPSMTGPWTDAGGPIVGPRTCSYTADPTCHPSTIDPAEFTDQDGQKYLYYGSFFGGTLVQKLTADGMHVTGPAYEIGHWDRYEGTYVIRHDVGGKAYYYNFSSSANCCLGPNTAYSVVVSRATSPLGPFYDQNGFPMELPAADGSSPLAPTARPASDPGLANVGGQGGGYPTLIQNGNTWDGVGHNALITDLSGHMWIVYHGVDKTSSGGVSNGWVNSFPGPTPPQITYRQLLIDSLDWTKDGWPVTNGGAGPSDSPMPAPDTTPLFGSNFNPSSGCGAPPFASTTAFSAISGTLSYTTDAPACVAGGYAAIQDGLAVNVDANSAPTGYRAECDLRLESGASGRYGCVVSYRPGRSASAGGRYIAAFIDPAANALVTVAYNNGHPIGRERSTALPSGFDNGDWHHLTVEQDTSASGRPVYRFTLSDTGRDPLAVQTRTFPTVFGSYGGAVGFVAQGGARADIDNITVASLDERTVPTPPVPSLGTALPAYSDEFDGSSLGAQWSLVRPDPSLYSVGSGQLSLTANGDIYRQINSAKDLVLETPPSGDYAVETKITFGPTTNYQQAGLLIYSDDDHYIKFGPAHLNSLNLVLDGHESLEPLPAHTANCDVQPAATSNIAVMTYTAQQCPNEGEGWTYLANPRPTPNDGPNAGPPATDWLRIYKHGDVYTPYTSVDDVHWVEGGSWTLTAVDASHPVKIGFFAFGGSPTVVAHFDYIHVYGSAGTLGGGGMATPELGSGELLVTGLAPILGAVLYRRRRRVSTPNR